jgi:outer membrane lipoprotein SlyB
VDPPGTSAGFNADSKVVTSFQIGPDLSNQGMVMLGAGGGAAYKKQPNSYEQPRWEVTVKLDSGQKRVVTVAYEPFVREGDRVRVAGNSLELLD